MFTLTTVRRNPTTETCSLLYQNEQQKHIKILMKYSDFGKKISCNFSRTPLYISTLYLPFIWKKNIMDKSLALKQEDGGLKF